MANIRLMPPGNGTNAVVVCSGRKYTQTPGGTIDVADFDAAELEANGWVRVGVVGTTAQRPVTPAKGMIYVDTTVSKVIHHEGATWRDCITGNTV
jgi:hypothetical protein